MSRRLVCGLLPVVSCLVLAAAAGGAPRGYYRFPDVHRDTVVFCAEGDLWTVPLAGGVASRLTAHPGDESHPAISPDGATVAFVGHYDGSQDVYTVPLAGGLPVRHTWEGRPGRDGPRVVGWAPDGRILYATRRFSGLPDTRLALLDPTTHEPEAIPLAQAADGSFTPDGRTLYFTRQAFQGHHARFYSGGTAQNLWRFAPGDLEALPLSADHPGTSKLPLWWNGRVVFVSDRGPEGSMNLWSMDPDGGDLRQLTRHDGWDVKEPGLSAEGVVVYQLGADLRAHDLRSGEDRVLDVVLASDLDASRERWIEKPLEYLTAAHLSPTGDRVALTARGEVFVVPTGPGRLVRATRSPDVRYRAARFLPGTEPAGRDPRRALGRERRGRVVGAARRRARRARADHGGRHDLAHRRRALTGRALDRPRRPRPGPLADPGLGRPHAPPRVVAVLGLRRSAELLARRPLRRVVGLREQPARPHPRARHRSRGDLPADDRPLPQLRTGLERGRPLDLLPLRPALRVARDLALGRAPADPFFDKQTRVYAVALEPGARPPFAPPDELHPRTDTDDDEDDDGEPARVSLEREGLVTRLFTVPVPPHNRSSLAIAGERLLWLRRETASEKPGVARHRRDLVGFALGDEDAKPVVLVKDVRRFELSADRTKLLVVRRPSGRDEPELHVLDVAALGDGAVSDDALRKGRLDLSDWTFPLDPHEEWRQMFVGRPGGSQRDYFYDQGMHGADWPAMLDEVPAAGRRA